MLLATQWALSTSDFMLYLVLVFVIVFYCCGCMCYCVGVSEFLGCVYCFMKEEQQ